MNVPLYAQRDPQWAAHRINNTSSTLGQYGCTISCIAMSLTHAGQPLNPRQTEERLRGLGAFQGDLVLWGKTPYFRPNGRFYCVDKPAPLEEIKAVIRQGRPVLLQVELGNNSNKPNHWVLAVDENFTINDPWHGETAPITKHYGANPAVAILGGAYFDWPIPQPVDNRPTYEELRALQDAVKQKQDELGTVRIAYGELLQQYDALKGDYQAQEEGEIALINLYEDKLKAKDSRILELEQEIVRLTTVSETKPQIDLSWSTIFRTIFSLLFKRKP